MGPPLQYYIDPVPSKISRAVLADTCDTLIKRRDFLSIYSRPVNFLNLNKCFFLLFLRFAAA